MRGGRTGDRGRRGQKIIKAPNIKALSENFARDLELQLGFPVKLVQDSRAAAWGEYVAGYGQGKSSVVCVTLGTGIGTGIVLSGKVYDGGLGCAGELGHTPWRKTGDPAAAEKTAVWKNTAREAGWTSPRRNYWAGEKLRQTC